MDIVFHYQEELKSSPTTDEQKTCYEKALREAISKGILVDYLTRKGTAVINMLTNEYEYEVDIQTKTEEAFEKGEQKKAEETAKAMLADKIPTDKVVLYSGLSLDKVLELQKQINK